MDTYFPNPIEHAASLLDVCGSVEAARAVAATNYEFAATDKEFRYWHMVAEALLLPEDACLEN